MGAALLPTLFTLVATLMGALGPIGGLTPLEPSPTDKRLLWVALSPGIDPQFVEAIGEHTGARLIGATDEQALFVVPAALRDEYALYFAALPGLRLVDPFLSQRAHAAMESLLDHSSALRGLTHPPRLVIRLHTFDPDRLDAFASVFRLTIVRSIESLQLLRVEPPEDEVLLWMQLLRLAPNVAFFEMESPASLFGL